jgi:hypothetical protein
MNRIRTLTSSKRRKVLFSIALIAIVTLAGSGVFWFFMMPDVDLWLDPNCSYQKVAGDWVTVNFQNNNTSNGTFAPINCKNNGALTATFEIIVVFSGASFSTDTPLPYEQINSTAAKFAFTLGGYQEKNVPVYFTITNGTRFIISHTLDTNQSLLRVMNAQKSITPWDRSYRELWYSFYGDKFEAAVIS